MLDSLVVMRIGHGPVSRMRLLCADFLRLRTRGPDPSAENWPLRSADMYMMMRAASTPLERQARKGEQVKIARAALISLLNVHVRGGEGSFGGQRLPSARPASGAQQQKQ